MTARELIESEADAAVLAEPNTPQSRQFGSERETAGDVYKGQFGTLRFVARADGKIVAGLLVGRQAKKDPWRVVLMGTSPDYRRRGLMTGLFAKALHYTGPLADASEYSADGQAFRMANPRFFEELREAITRDWANEWLSANAAVFQAHGFIPEIVGSVATKGASDKDLDIVMKSVAERTLEEELTAFYEQVAPGLGLTSVSETPIEAWGHDSWWFVGAVIPETDTLVEFYFGGALSESVTIRVPPFAQGAFFQDHGSDEEFWGVKQAPKAKSGDSIEFKFGSKSVARALISRIEAPGQSACGHSGKFKDKWKIHWKDSSFKRLAEDDDNPLALRVSPDSFYDDENTNDETITFIIYPDGTWISANELVMHSELRAVAEAKLFGGAIDGSGHDIGFRASSPGPKRAVFQADKGSRSTSLHGRGRTVWVSALSGGDGKLRGKIAFWESMAKVRPHLALAIKVCGGGDYPGDWQVYTSDTEGTYDQIMGNAASQKTPEQLRQHELARQQHIASPEVKRAMKSPTDPKPGRSMSAQDRAKLSTSEARTLIEQQGDPDTFYAEEGVVTFTLFLDGSHVATSDPLTHMQMEGLASHRLYKTPLPQELEFNTNPAVPDASDVRLKISNPPPKAESLDYTPPDRHVTGRGRNSDSVISFWSDLGDLNEATIKKCINLVEYASTTSYGGGGAPNYGEWTVICMDTRATLFSELFTAPDTKSDEEHEASRVAHELHTADPIVKRAMKSPTDPKPGRQMSAQDRAKLSTSESRKLNEKEEDPDDLYDGDLTGIVTFSVFRDSSWIATLAPMTHYLLKQLAAFQLHGAPLSQGLRDDLIYSTNPDMPESPEDLRLSRSSPPPTKQDLLKNTFIDGRASPEELKVIFWQDWAQVKPYIDLVLDLAAKSFPVPSLRAWPREDWEIVCGDQAGTYGEMVERSPESKRGAELARQQHIADPMAKRAMKSPSDPKPGLSMNAQDRAKLSTSESRKLIEAVYRDPKADPALLDAIQQLTDQADADPQIEDFTLHSGNQGRWIDLRSIRVKPEARNQGVGSQYITAVKSIAKQFGVPVILGPEADRGHKADLERFYRGHDFTPHKGRNRDYSVGGAFGGEWIHRP